jgi:hypothetical protein
MSSIYDRLTDLDISLPPLAIPAGAYVPFVRTGNLVFLSGHIAKRDGKAWVGQLGRDMTTATGKKAARAVAIDLLAPMRRSAISTRSSARSHHCQRSADSSSTTSSPTAARSCSARSAEKGAHGEAPTASPSCRSAPASKSS